MGQFLEHIIELKMQTMYVIEQEIAALRELDLKKFRELQHIEKELLTLIDEARREVKKDKSTVLKGSHDMLSRLCAICLQFDECLAEKHAAVGDFQNSYKSCALLH
ncbi:hypothetical protein [Anaplasma platys]|uniref:hypothetical protein n=1 Tax=Anaplasma platys TaxID=949 RepID=UPI00145C5BB6|nr:hypothetical protein [Anaplasma platys]